MVPERQEELLALAVRRSAVRTARLEQRCRPGGVVLNLKRLAERLESCDDSPRRCRLSASSGAPDL